MKLRIESHIILFFSVRYSAFGSVPEHTVLHQHGAIIAIVDNRPFPNYLWPLFQSESWCSSFHMKISFDSHANEN